MVLLVISFPEWVELAREGCGLRVHAVCVRERSEFRKLEVLTNRGVATLRSNIDSVGPFIWRSFSYAL